MTRIGRTSDARIDRRALFASGSAAALLATVGISAEAAPTRGGHLRAALSGGHRGETWLDLPGGRFLQAARHAVFETLTEIGADGTLQPGLAVRWAAEDDGRIWHFELATDVRFHSGRALDVGDVTASLARAGVLAYAHDGDVVIELAEPNPTLPFALARDGIMIFSADQLETGVPLTDGTGVYALKRFEPGRAFFAQRVAHHRKDGTAGWFDTVEFVAISDEAVRAEAVRDGFVDVADVRDPSCLDGCSDLTFITEGDQIAALRKEIKTGARTGVAPLDDMRFAERWWAQS